MDDAVRGAQTVHRAALLLRAIGRSVQGATLAELVATSGLTRPTVHRLVSSLTAEGLVDRDPESGLWHLGPEVYVMGAVAARRFPIEEIARPGLQRLASLTGESAFLSMRRGNETVCLVREDGSFPVRSFVLYEGVRFPLGVASAGLAIMAYLSDHEREELLETFDLTSSELGRTHTAATVRANIEATRRTGYAVNPGLIVEGSWGMGAAIFDRAGNPAWALSLTGIESRFRPERQPELGRLLLAEAHRITTKLQAPAEG
jgi:DNA-binding IclR family transcriptional regulator